MTDYHHDTDQDALWVKDPPPVSLSAVSRFRRWLFPALMAAVVLGLVVALGVSNSRSAARLRSVEQSVSNLSDVIQSLNASLQHAQETAEEVQRLQFAVEYQKEQLTSVSDALKQLSVVESLSRTVASLKCSVDRIINNRSTADACCPLGWSLSENSCYFFSHQSLSWNQSTDWCEKQEAHLVILHTDKEWDFVTRHTLPEFFWVGLSDWRTGRWEWVNRTPYVMELRRWTPGQPDSWTGHGLGAGDEDCAHLHSNGRLNDLHCSTRMRFICQKHST